MSPTDIHIGTGVTIRHTNLERVSGSNAITVWLCFHERAIDLSYVSNIENMELYIDPKMNNDIVYVRYSLFRLQ